MTKSHKKKYAALIAGCYLVGCLISIYLVMGFNPEAKDYALVMTFGTISLSAGTIMIYQMFSTNYY